MAPLRRFFVRIWFQTTDFGHRPPWIGRRTSGVESPLGHRNGHRTSDLGPRALGQPASPQPPAHQETGDWESEIRCSRWLETRDSHSTLEPAIARCASIIYRAGTQPIAHRAVRASGSPIPLTLSISLSISLFLSLSLSFFSLSLSLSLSRRRSH
eukprot:1173746-Pyramimonas_sp.AAC.1